jgi:SAM-dependent methyltransferase
MRSNMSRAVDTYETLPDNYFTLERQDVIPLVRGRHGRILEIGCGEGSTSHALKSLGVAGWACGVELSAEAAEVARERLDLVIEGNVERVDLPIESGSIDTVLALDVLEHLMDPWSTVARLTRFLRPGGAMIVSLPNVRHIRLLRDLVVRGEWRYQDAGTLDRTHLRFFTRRSAIELLASNGLVIDAVHSTGSAQRPGSPAHLMNRATLGFASEFFDYQYIIRGIKAGN